jgi:CheY-like chemotaxis protein
MYASAKDYRALLGGKNFLLLEDQDIVVRSIRRVLEREGAKLIHAGTSQELIESYRHSFQNQDSIDLVILDLCIPDDKGGCEVLEDLKRINPALLSLATSGNWDDPVMRQPVNWGFCGAIAKPFQRLEFLDKIVSIISCM